MTANAAELQRFAEDLSRRAGAYLMEHLGKLNVHQISEKQRNDFVTHVDRGSEALIVEEIRRSYPEHSILAEEGATHQNSGSLTWIVDPLDGTLNYIKEIPFFGVSIAVEDEKGLLVGVVYNPALDELFSARRGGGATLNRRSLQVSAQTDLRRAFLATGFPHHSKYHLPDYLHAFSEIFIQAAGVRRLGSAALDLCYTASGCFEAYWELGLQSWDIAAGSLIVREAGGAVSDFRGGDTHLQSGRIAAGNKEIHSQIINILAHYFKEPDHV